MMTTEMEKAAQRMNEAKDPAEKAHIKSEIDKMPISTGELDQVQQRESDRQAADVDAYRKKRKQ